ncbi:MAG: HNH endonuclease [Bacteroidetes bacterium]|nr:HNH endonuclease [Bacteroidota bacterium]
MTCSCSKTGRLFRCLCRLFRGAYTPWHEGGKATEENGQTLCKEDNRRKSRK